MPRNGSGVYSAPPNTLATTLTTIKSPEYNAFVNDLVSDANAARPIVAGGTGANTVAAAQTALSVVGYNSQTLTAAQQGQARSNVSAALFGHLYGLTLSNNATDATNDIDIAVGEAASTETNPVLMVLASALTKRLDAAWAVGSGNGGLDTGSIANTTYHIWLIQRSDTGVVDALFSASATAPTMPTNYDRKRRIGSIIRSVGAILAFYQDDDKFFLTSPVVDRSSTSALAVALLALTVPAGVAVRPILRNTLASSTSPNIVNLMGNAAQGTGGATTVQQINSTATTVTDIVVIDGTFTTNTSSQIYYGVTISSGTIGTNSLSTLGWYDSRGR